MPTHTDERRNQANPPLCDCGDVARWRVPLDDVIAEQVYGIEARGFYDLDGDCYMELLSGGYLAGVWDDILRLDNTGAPIPRDEDPRLPMDLMMGLRG